MRYTVEISEVDNSFGKDIEVLTAKQFKELMSLYIEAAHGSDEAKGLKETIKNIMRHMSDDELFRYFNASFSQSSFMVEDELKRRKPEFTAAMEKKVWESVFA